MPDTMGDVFGDYGAVNAETTERAVRVSIDESGLNPEQVTDRIEWAVREAYIRGTGDGYAKGVKEFALIWPIKSQPETTEKSTGRRWSHESN